MARKRIKNKRLAVILICAAIMAVHAAYAPIFSRADASTDHSATQVTPVEKSIPVNTNNREAIEIATVPGEVDHAPLPNLQARWDFKSYAPLQGTPTIGLIPDPSNVVRSSVDDGIAIPGIQVGPPYSIPSTVEPSIFTGDGGIGFTPRTIVDGSTRGRAVTVNGALPTEVPEPAMISLLIGGWMLVRRTPRM